MRRCFLSYGLEYSTWAILKIQLTSTFYSLILPGDLVAGGVTWHLLSKDNKKRAEVAGVVTFLKLLNMITLFPLAILGLIMEEKLVEFNVQFPIFASLVILIILLLPFFSKSSALVIEGASSRFFGVFGENIKSMSTSLWNAVHTCNEMPWKEMKPILFWSFTFQIISILFIWLCIHISTIDVPIYVSLWILALMVAVHTLPVTFAGTGLRELSLIFVLQKLYNVPPEKSLLLSGVIFLTSLIFAAIPGAYFALRQKWH